MLSGTETGGMLWEDRVSWREGVGIDIYQPLKTSAELQLLGVHTSLDSILSITQKKNM